LLERLWFLSLLASASAACSTTNAAPADAGGGNGGSCGPPPPADSCLYTCTGNPAPWECTDAGWVCPEPNGDCDAGDVLPDASCQSSLSSLCDSDAQPDECPPLLVSGLPSEWCARHPQAGAILGSCGGYIALTEGTGTDGELLFFYPDDGGSLAAVVAAPDLSNPFCLAGSPGFQLPAECFGNGADLTSKFSGPGAASGCAGFDAGPDAGGD
jgi:hypothetical protein